MTKQIKKYIYICFESRKKDTKHAQKERCRNAINQNFIHTFNQVSKSIARKQSTPRKKSLSTIFKVSQIRNDYQVSKGFLVENDVPPQIRFWDPKNKRTLPSREIALILCHFISCDFNT